MIKTGNWKTKFELEQCKGDHVPDIFNFRWVRKGGRLGHSDHGMTITLSELKELSELFTSTLKKHRKRST